MNGYLALVLHAHLPFVRHPEHRTSLEETWLFEAITETYLPLLRALDRLEADHLPGSITFTVSAPLCAMLTDPLLQQRYEQHLERLIKLSDLEIHRTLFEKQFHELAILYHERFLDTRAAWQQYGRNLVGAFRRLQLAGRIELIASSATHAVLPLLRNSPESVRAQVLIGRDAHIANFGAAPRGIWLPECAWAPELDEVLREAGYQWFITETHGILSASPRPIFGHFAPVATPGGLAAFGRDTASAQQVWSRDAGYPGDPDYRDFYRDIAFDLDLDYLREFLPIPDTRTFTGLKYYRITGGGVEKAPYSPAAARARIQEHARHFLASREKQFAELLNVFNSPIIVCPYDAELFGHWWYEGPEFIEALLRKAAAGTGLQCVTPTQYLARWRLHQASMPAASSWGEEGFWKVWLNERNHWIVQDLNLAQRRMAALVRGCDSLGAEKLRALRQAGRELLLAQSSDWPFIMRTGTSPEYARMRVTQHISRFNTLCDQIEAGSVEVESLRDLEETDNVFPDIDVRAWRPASE